MGNRWQEVVRERVGGHLPLLGLGRARARVTEIQGQLEPPQGEKGPLGIHSFKSLCAQALPLSLSQSPENKGNAILSGGVEEPAPASVAPELRLLVSLPRPPQHLPGHPGSAELPSLDPI